MKPVLIFALLLSFNSVAYADSDNCTAEKKAAVCTDEIVKKQVDWACGLVESKGKDAIPEINAMRYECCGEPNYVWINDMHPKMIMHPIKKELDNKDLSGEKDADGKKLFIEFVKAVQKTSSGAWVDYKWTKFGEKAATPKKSWVKQCKVGSTAEKWVVGSGTWK